jgi:hypothetical protein
MNVFSQSDILLLLINENAIGRKMSWKLVDKNVVVFDSISRQAVY